MENKKVNCPSCGWSIDYFEQKQQGLGFYEENCENEKCKAIYQGGNIWLSDAWMKEFHRLKDEHEEREDEFYQNLGHYHNSEGRGYCYICRKWTEDFVEAISNP